MTTYDKVKAILIDMGCDEREITPQATFVYLGLDSLEMAQLVLELEESLKVEIPDDDLQKLLTVQDAADYADSHSRPN